MNARHLVPSGRSTLVAICPGRCVDVGRARDGRCFYFQPGRGGVSAATPRPPPPHQATAVGRRPGRPVGAEGPGLPEAAAAAPAGGSPSPGRRKGKAGICCSEVLPEKGTEIGSFAELLNAGKWFGGSAPISAHEDSGIFQNWKKIW